MTRISRTVTTWTRAGDLAKKLAEIDPDTPVGFAHPAHDHWNTTLVSGVKSVDTRQVVWSEYNSSFKLVDRDDEADDDDDEVGDESKNRRRVVVLE